MYETLTYPHPSLRTSDIQAQSLAHMASEIGKGYRRRQDQTTLEAADDILLAVRHTLRFPDPGDSYYDDPILLPLDKLPTEQLTNCIGHTIVASECLDAAHIDNLVTYSNGHAWNMLPDRDAGNIYMRDLLRPDFDAEVHEAFGRVGLQDIDDEIAQRGRAFVRFDTGRAAALAGVHFGTLTTDNPFVFSRRPRLEYVDNWVHQTSELQMAKRFQEARTLFVSMYAPKVGQVILKHFAEFHVALANKHSEEAVEHLEVMGKLYPEMDARQKHRQIFMLIEQLLGEDKPELAGRAVTTYFSGFDKSKDSRLADKEGDCWKKIYNYTHNPAFARRASTQWERARQRSRDSNFKNKVTNKLVKLEA